MSFLRNDGDIIIDAVLTDIGRSNLAAGLPLATQWAAGDTEIDYSLYNSANASGSAYYDVDIYNVPVFEPSTFSQTAMGSKLFSYADNTLQYLPVLKLNQSTKVSSNLTTIDAGSAVSNTNAINLLTTDSIISFLGTTTVASNTTFIDGRQNVFLSTNPGQANALSSYTTRFIRVDQGFDSQNVVIPLGDLEETSFSVYVNRLFLKLLDSQYNASVQPVIVANPFTKNQATNLYKLPVETPNFFAPVEVKPAVNNVSQLATSLATSLPNQVGRELQFSLQISDFLAANLSYYFTTYGITYPGTSLGGVSTAGNTIYQISTTVRVVGDNYGFAVDIPVKLFYKA